jgi:3-oxoacyl-[acyl-carrier-protein] synthase III
MPESMVLPAVEPVPPQLRPGAEIAGLGVALPEAVVANAPIAARLGVDESWIVQRTGIRERRSAAGGEHLADYATLAGARALASSDLVPGEVDLVLVATMSNDELTPGAAPRVAAALGADGAGAIDVNAACNGFVSALALGCAQIESGRATTVLVIGADLMTRLTDPDDRATAALFGDGAGAIVLRGAERGRIGPVVLGSDGSCAELIRAGREEGLMRIKGHETFRNAVERMCEVSIRAADAAGLELSDIDLFVYHQANQRILRAIGAQLMLAPEEMVDCIGRYGNTSAATIPLALEEANLSGALRHGAKVLLAAFGGGLTWGATVLEWGSGEDAA